MGVGIRAIVSQRLCRAGTRGGGLVLRPLASTVHESAWEQVVHLDYRCLGDSEVNRPGT